MSYANMTSFRWCWRWLKSLCMQGKRSSNGPANLARLLSLFRVSIVTSVPQGVMCEELGPTGMVLGGGGTFKSWEERKVLRLLGHSPLE